MQGFCTVLHTNGKRRATGCWMTDFLGCLALHSTPGTCFACAGFPLSNQDGMSVKQESKMNSVFSAGALIPLWILGAGLVVGVMQWFSTPRPVPRDRQIGSL